MNESTHENFRSDLDVWRSFMIGWPEKKKAIPSNCITTIRLRFLSSPLRPCTFVGVSVCVCARICYSRPRLNLPIVDHFRDFLLVRSSDRVTSFAPRSSRSGSSSDRITVASVRLTSSTSCAQFRGVLRCGHKVQQRLPGSTHAIEPSPGGVHFDGFRRESTSKTTKCGYN